ncbi:MAG: hypothetical protein Q8M76_08020, partial [Spirochaetaceae bacterium]|nr:hypothetical protein [Spirochaetaceae bacterium]
SLRAETGNREVRFKGHVESVQVLGYDGHLDFVRTAEGLAIEVNGSFDAAYPVCLKIELD